MSAPSSSSLPASRPTSAAYTRGSRPSTAATATPTAGRRVRLPDSTSSSPTISPHSNGIGAAAQQQQQLQLQQGSGAPSRSLQGSAANAGTSAGPSSWAATEGGQPGERSGAAAAAYAAGAAAAAAAAGGGHGGTAHVAGVDHHHSQQQQKDADDIADQLQHSPSHDIDAMLRHRELERLAADQQQVRGGLPGGKATRFLPVCLHQGLWSIVKPAAPEQCCLPPSLICFRLHSPCQPQSTSTMVGQRCAPCSFFEHAWCVLCPCRRSWIRSSIRCSSRRCR